MSDGQKDGIGSRTSFRELGRRSFLGTATAVGIGTAGFLAGRGPSVAGNPAAAPATLRLMGESCTLTPPPGFPSAITLYQQGYENWSRETIVEDVWTCAPASAAEVVAVANWAVGAGYRVRPRGYMHNWAPFTVDDTETCDSPVVLVDTTTCLVSMELITGSPLKVKVGPGATMEAILGFLEGNNAGLASVPAVGQITIAGAMAIDAHGAAVPADGETPLAGQSYGSLSNLVLSLDAVVWNHSTDEYEVRTFTRADNETKALLTHLGRTFVTSITLQVAANQKLRCQSYTNITATTLFAAPAVAGSQSFAAHIRRTGRVEAILYPFTDKPWLKVWSVAPTKPLLSRTTTTPYNYPFSDNVPQPVAILANEIIGGNPSAAPALGAAMYSVTVSGLTAFLAYDLWGAAKNTQLYIKATTLRLAEGGGVVLCRRADIQRVVSEFYAKYAALVAAYEQQGNYPMNGPIEIRVSGLDRGSAVQASGAEPPSLSALLERTDHPEWDSAVWTNMLTIPDTPYASEFYTEMGNWARTNYASYGAVRVEWSKGWAHTNAGPWTDTAALTQTIPDDFRVGRTPNEDWDWALGVYNDLDPHRIFTSPLLDDLTP